jgi:hypothetical protein
MNNKLVKCYIWRIIGHVVETWTFRRIDQIYFEGSEERCWGRMEKINWTHFVNNDEVLHLVEEERNILCTKEGSKERRLTGLVTCCLLSASFNTLLKEIRGVKKRN